MGLQNKRIICIIQMVIAQARAITYFGCAEILAPTAVFVLVLGIKTIAQTLVGAISDRQRLRQLLFKSIKGCFVSSPLFNYNANSAAPCGCSFLFAVIYFPSLGFRSFMKSSKPL